MLDCRIYRQELHIGVASSVAVFDVRGWVNAGVYWQSPNGIGAATASVLHAPTTLDSYTEFSTALQLTAAAPWVGDLNVYSAAYLVVRMSAAHATSTAVAEVFCVLKSVPGGGMVEPLITLPGRSW